MYIRCSKLEFRVANREGKPPYIEVNYNGWKPIDILYRPGMCDGLLWEEIDLIQKKLWLDTETLKIVFAGV